MQVPNINSTSTSQKLGFGMKFSFVGPKAREYARALDGGMTAQGIPSSIVYDEIRNQNHVATEFDALQFNEKTDIQSFFRDAIKIITK